MKIKAGLRDSDTLKTKKCLVSEAAIVDEKTKKVIRPAHACISSKDCQGERQCTSFGWCRGKALCKNYSKKASCLIIEAEDMKCEGDFDCRG